MDVLLCDLVLSGWRSSPDQLDNGIVFLLEVLEVLLGCLETLLQLHFQLVVLALLDLQRILQLDETSVTTLRAHSRKFLEIDELLRRAHLLVLEATRWPEGCGVLLERIEAAIALVLLALVIAGSKCLDCRVALDAMLVAQRLARLRAVHVRDQHVRGACIFFCELVPIWLHLLAMASPRRKEFYECALPLASRVECVHRVFGRTIHGQHGQEQDIDAQH